MGKRGKEKTLEKRLRLYSATAAGVLAMAPTAQAAVQYSGIQNLPVSSSQFQLIDLNNDGIPDFRIGLATFFVPGSIICLDSETGGQGHIAETYKNDPAQLGSNYAIGPTLVDPANFWYIITNYSDTLNGTIFGSYYSGNFNNVKGYIGVRFSASCGTAYGWIQYQGVTSFGNSPSGTIIDWAYEDTCQPILAGDKGSAVPVPTMNQWGLIVFTLLLGAAAAREIRRLSKKKRDVSA